MHATIWTEECDIHVSSTETVHELPSNAMTDYECIYRVSFCRYPNIIIIFDEDNCKYTSTKVSECQYYSKYR